MPRLARLLHGYHNMHKETKSGRIRLAIMASILIDVLSKKLNREPEARAAVIFPSFTRSRTTRCRRLCTALSSWVCIAQAS